MILIFIQSNSLVTLVNHWQGCCIHVHEQVNILQANLLIKNTSPHIYVNANSEIMHHNLAISLYSADHGMNAPGLIKERQITV